MSLFKHKLMVLHFLIGWSETGQMYCYFRNKKGTVKKLHNFLNQTADKNVWTSCACRWADRQTDRQTTLYHKTFCLQRHVKEFLAIFLNKQRKFVRIVLLLFHLMCPVDKPGFIVLVFFGWGLCLCSFIIHYIHLEMT